MRGDAEKLPHIEVACGVLRLESGDVLIAQRPEGKIAAGKWEFPGGKIEAGESSRAALGRELHEELGIELRVARPLIRFTHAYWDRVVTLDTWVVSGWDGEVHGREGQRFEWRTPAEALNLDVLPTVAPILRALALPEDYVFTPPDANERRIREGLAQLPRRALLRLRLPSLEREAYAALAQSVLADARALGLRVMLDRDRAMAQELGADGWHLPQQVLMSLAQLEPESLLRIASCHDAASLARARELGFDAAVLGTIAATHTHPGTALLGWNEFAKLAGKANLPVYGIGGVGPNDKATAFEHRAQGVAGISAYWS
ncbi:MAG: Nudix family hydrolase [Panacagrimonas sp.]